MHKLELVPLKEIHEKEFFDFLDNDRILNIFTILDLRYKREKTDVWMSLDEGNICGYIMLFDKKIVHARGNLGSIKKILRNINIDESVFNVEPNHLEIFEKFLMPIEPTDESSRNRITTYLVMKINAQMFKPVVKHRTKKLRTEDLDDVFKQDFTDDYRKVIENAIKNGIAVGAYKNESLASIATIPQIIDDLALIRGMYTVPSLRNRGFATSACSAIVEEVTKMGKEAMLWVANENIPAIKVYKKIGFKETEHILLGFKARRL